MMTLTSNLGGEYIFPLIGECIPAKPQGPFSVKKGSRVEIPFRNVFPANTQFSLRVDNPNFSVKAQENIKAKKSQNIHVAFEGKLPPGSVHTGLLTITPLKTEGNYSWVFYLKGFIPDS